MKNRIWTASAVGMGILAGYFLASKATREKIKDQIEDLIYKVRNYNLGTQHSILEDAGIPDQVGNIDHTQLENAKMVSEGSQYGVNYYNELQEEEVRIE